MKFGVIYDDKPWTYHAWSGASIPQRKGRGMADSHYQTMGDGDIAALPYKELAEKDCLLFQWSTWPCLQSAFAIPLAQGFTYRTCAFLWVKLSLKSMSLSDYKKSLLKLLNIKNLWGGLETKPLEQAIETFPKWHSGLGFWSRANTEPCLLFGKGAPYRKSKRVRQLVVAPLGKHSAKPLEIYERIEQLVDGPYLEIFARITRQGWISVGDGVDGLDVRYSLPALVKAENENEFFQLKEQLYLENIALAVQGDETVIRSLDVAWECYGHCLAGNELEATA